MHIQIINFRLEGMSEQDYVGLATSAAPAFAALPGLVSKTWLANPETNTYGGVYLWHDRRAMERYRASDIYKGMLSNPNLQGVTDRDFAVLDNPSGLSAVRRGSDRTDDRPRLQYAPGGAAFVA